ncbi:MAG: transcription termination/antitermination NusG family protein, partial [Planctomycetota bacterium]
MPERPSPPDGASSQQTADPLPDRELGSAAPADAPIEPAEAPNDLASDETNATSESASESSPQPSSNPDAGASAEVGSDDEGKPSSGVESFDDQLNDQPDENLDEGGDAAVASTAAADETEQAEVGPVGVGPVDSALEEVAETIELDWYILKVQSNRERSIADALRRKIAIEGLDDYFGDVVVPTEKVTEFKGGKKKVVERKLYPGYIVVRMHINDDTWFAVRETSGIGDFTGSGGK